jgi:protein-S-isoprenylcysteine O-methyltransferase Ste14
VTTKLLHRIARLRVTLGFLFGLAALWLARPTTRSLAIGAAFAVFGEAFRVWAAGHLEKGREVTSSGPYAFTRHPLYVGSSLIGVGFAIASASVVVGIMVVAYLGVTLTAAVRTEEAHLTEKFGQKYPAYRDGRTTDVRRTFSFERVMRNREYRALAGLAIGMAVLAWKAGIVLS